MSRLKLLSLFAVVLFCGLASADATDDKNIERLKWKIVELFGNDSEDPFSRALRMLADYEASNEQIEVIIGNHFSKVLKMWDEVRRFAGLIVISSMKNFERSYIERNPTAARLFQDFYDMILADLDPETVGINRDLYIIYEIVDEVSFTEAYTKLVDYYQHYSPLKEFMEKEKEEMMNRIKRLIMQKNPDFKPKSVDPFPNIVSMSVEPTVETPQVEPPQPPPKEMFSGLKGKTIVAYQDVKTNELTVLAPLRDKSVAIVKVFIGLLLMSVML
jgi:hypothetical protein